MPSHQDTIARRLARRLAMRAEELAPSVTDRDRVAGYADDPIGFARDVLGLLCWSRQGEIVIAPSKHKRVSVVSGHKVGKSAALAILALWFYCCFPGARVVIMAVTDRQVNGIIWRDVRRFVRNALIPIPGASEIHKIASSGLVDPVDFSEIKGYTAREAEGAAGTSGAYILYLVDEASAVDESIFEAIEGNRAAGNAWLFMISNPTRAEGTFYDSHHDKAELYRTIHIDSRESPNVTGECEQLWGAPMPGLAVNEWIEEKEREWGADSPLFKIRVAGDFAVAEEGKIFPMGLLAEALSRDESADDTGRLYIGVDPAGPGDGGDESAFCPRRGQRVLWPRLRSALSDVAHVAEVLDIIAENQRPGDSKLPPVVVCDYEGPIGMRVYQAFRTYLDAHPAAFVLARVRSSDRALRQPQLYDRMRDEIWAVGRAFLRGGGSLPEHSKLIKDLHAPEWKQNDAGRLKATPKRELHKKLHRSTDTGDAFLLSCWEPLALRMGDNPPPPQAARPEVYREAQEARGVLDPYGGVDPYGR